MSQWFKDNILRSTLSSILSNLSTDMKGTIIKPGYLLSHVSKQQPCQPKFSQLTFAFCHGKAHFVLNVTRNSFWHKFFIAGNSLEIFIKFPVTGNCLEIHKHINLCSGAKYRVEPQTTFAERSGSPPKRRTPKIRKFVFCIVVIYALFKRIVELSTKVILLSESFTSNTTNFDAIVKQSFCCENLQIFALIKG